LGHKSQWLLQRIQQKAGEIYWNDVAFWWDFSCFKVWILLRLLFSFVTIFLLFYSLTIVFPPNSVHHITNRDIWLLTRHQPSLWHVGRIIYLFCLTSLSRSQLIGLRLRYNYKTNTDDRLLWPERLVGENNMINQFNKRQKHNLFNTLPL